MYFFGSPANMIIWTVYLLLISASLLLRRDRVILYTSGAALIYTLIVSVMLGNESYTHAFPYVYPTISMPVLAFLLYAFMKHYIPAWLPAAFAGLMTGAWWIICILIRNSIFGLYFSVYEVLFAPVYVFLPELMLAVSLIPLIQSLIQRRRTDGKEITG